VRRDGRVQHIGAYPGPGGADGIAMAPPRFGRASGLLLLSIDQDVYFAPAVQLAPYAGQVLVGTELGGSFWLIRPTATGFATDQVAVELPSDDLNLEGAAYVP
jgi:hypothetical protein